MSPRIQVRRAGKALAMVPPGNMQPRITSSVYPTGPPPYNFVLGKILKKCARADG